MKDPRVCGCRKGYMSLEDNMCKFCREKKYSRRKAKLMGVSHRGDGLSLEQIERYALKEFAKLP